MNKNLLLYSVLTILLLGCHEVNIEKDQPPNILWIIAEDLSQDLGCYGNQIVRTPVLDSLAKEGVRFTHVFTTGPACTPSRTALATGMYQTAINAHHMRYPTEMRNPLPPGILPLNELMRNQGYLTANLKDQIGTGKTDWSFSSPHEQYDVKNWDSITENRPFFAVVNLRLTHRPFERDTTFPIKPDAVQLPPYYPDHIVAKKDWAAYLETAQLMDKQVGQVLAELKKRNLSENTIIVFFSDHGRPMSRGKNYLYDSGTRIPLIIVAPKNSEWHQYLLPGTTNDKLISAIDISATTLSIAGGQNPIRMQGQIFVGPKKELDRSQIFAAGDRMGEIFFKSRSVRDIRYKYIRNFNHDFSVNTSTTAYRRSMHPIYHLLNILGEQGKLTPEQKALIDPMPAEELFDIISDPYEIKNLTSDPAFSAVLENMRKELDDWQIRTHDYGMDPDSDELSRAFDQYGKQGAKQKEFKIMELRNQVVEDMKIVTN